MALDTRPQTVTAAQFAAIFATEQAKDYPSVTALETRVGVALARCRLEDAARVLCCPFKAAPPNWQHGRVIYTIARAYLERGDPDTRYALLDIGTAKGFSALCLQWALEDAGRTGQVTSVDVMPPLARIRRSTPAEVDGLRTLPEILAPYPAAAAIAFRESTGIAILHASRDRIHVAFVDGKHTAEAVGAEWPRLASRQQPGDVAIFDDIQMSPVRMGLVGADQAYAFDELALDSVTRAYAIGVRR